jgi:hypothetical protein
MKLIALATLILAGCAVPSQEDVGGLQSDELFIVSTERLREELPVSRADAAIVRDAISRHVAASRVTEEGAMAIKVPIVAHMGPKRCVLLKTRAAAIGGGNPVYCYDQGGALIEAWENPGR